MKVTVKTSKMLAVSFSFLLLCQSCATYYKDSFPKALEKVSNKNKAVDILTVNGEKLKYKNIIAFNTNSYYGIARNNATNDTIPINLTTIKELKLKNNTVINVLTIIAGSVILGGILVFSIISEFDSEYED